MFPPADVVLAFALVALVLTLTPGLDTMLVLRSATVAGTASAVGVIVGIGAGVLLWGALAAAGVSAVLLASAWAYEVLRWAGVAYLLWIGIRMLVSAIRGRHVEATPDARRPGTFWGGVRQGAITNLLNPKVGAFYVAMLPQFIPADAPAALWGVTLAAVHVALGCVWLGLLVVVARSARRWLQKPVVARGIEGGAGAVIVGFGIVLAVEGASR